jgi:SH3-like domain-containing protein
MLRIHPADADRRHVRRSSATGWLWAGALATGLWLCGDITAQTPGTQIPGTPTPEAGPQGQPQAEQPQAEQPGQGSKPGEAPAAETPNPQQPDLQPIPTPKVMAVVQGEGRQLRCFASDSSPVFADPLPEGMPLEMIEEADGFVRVRGPFGPLGWVSKRFTETAAAGTVVVDGIGVSFRYRPKPGELPVEVLSKGTVLTVVGEEGDWWQVRNPNGSGWLKPEEVDVFTSPNPTLVERWREAGRVRAEMVAGFAVQQAAQAKAAQARQALLDQLETIHRLYRAELGKSEDQRDFAPVLAALSTLEEGLAEDETAVQSGIASLRGQVEEQQFYLRALAIRSDAPPRPAAANKSDRVARSRDGLDRFDAIGWLRYRPDAPAGEAFALEKGGRVMFFLESPDARYDLRLLDGLELGVVASGPAFRPHSESLRVMPVARLEVLGVPRR